MGPLVATILYVLRDVSRPFSFHVSHDDQEEIEHISALLAGVVHVLLVDEHDGLCRLGCPVLHNSCTNTPKMKYVSILYIKIIYTELQSFPTPFTIPTEHLKYTKEIL